MNISHDSIPSRRGVSLCYVNHETWYAYAPGYGYRGERADDARRARDAVAADRAWQRSYDRMRRDHDDAFVAQCVVRWINSLPGVVNKLTDLPRGVVGSTSMCPIAVGLQQALGATSARVEGGRVPVEVHTYNEVLGEWDVRRFDPPTCAAVFVSRFDDCDLPHYRSAGNDDW